MAGCRGIVSSPAPAPGTFQLSVILAGTGSGTVTSSPAGINCPGACSAEFNANTPVTLTATAGSTFTFMGWAGACSGTAACSVTLSAASSVTATFAAPTNTSFPLTVNLAGAGSGTVTSNPAGINCPTTCTAAFAANSAVSLTATPATGFSFGSWGGACSGTGSCTVTLAAAATVTANFGASLQSINHIVIFAQENRSFDQYFGALRGYWKQKGLPDQSFDGLPQFNPTSGEPPLQGPAPSNPGCNPNQAYPASLFCAPDSASAVTSYHYTSVCQENPSPFWNESHRAYNVHDPSGNSGPAMDGFVVAAADDARQQSPPLMDVNGLRAMGYFDGSDLNYYYYMATQFGTSDTWYSPLMDRTQLNRMYLLAATSQGLVHPIAPPRTQLTAPVIFQSLQNAGISWKIYVNPTNTSCESNPTSDCLYHFSYISQFTYGQTVLTTPSLLQNIVTTDQFLSDAKNGTLPAVALIEPPSNAGLDEHPSDFDTASPANAQAGAKWASGMINAVLASPNWKDSVTIFTYDENGGFFDHAAPAPMPSPDGIKPQDLVAGDICDTTATAGGATCDFTFTGFRVPLIVISPFSRVNFVSHQVRDYTAILKLIEARFNLSPLTLRDAAQPDMTDFFDFVNAPNATPPTPPVQTVGGACTLTPPTL